MAKEEKKKKKGSCLKTVLIIIAVIIVLAVIGSIFGEEDTPEKVGEVNTESNQTDQAQSVSNASSDSNSESQEDEQTVFTQGEIAEMNDIQITLVGYEESAGSEYNTPAEGNVYLLANFEITNNSDSDLTVSSAMSFEAYADDYALNYSISALIEKSDSTQLDGTVAPGKKMNGWIGYEVPADWLKVEIHFTDNVWSDNKFIFEITK